MFLASFLVLFLEVALIRWMPAYIRLLSYFSNFILLASFLGIGIGCLLAPARSRLFPWFPVLQAAVIAAVYFFRLEVTVPTSGSIYFSSGTAEKVVLVENTMLLPLLFVIVAALFATLAQRMGREMAPLPPLRAYTINIAGSLAGVVGFGVISWLELPPTVWFGVAFAVAVPLLITPEVENGGGSSLARRAPLAAVVVNLVLLAGSLALVHTMARGAIWSPYYKITVSQQGADTVVEVNNIFHQSMAPVEQKEYFYQWPYSVFGDTFQDVLILGAGSGTDVAAALRHGVRHVDAVEIDPVIIRLGREHHPDRPYSDPRVTVINDDARHFLRTTQKKYDLVVFALIDSLTMQSSFSGVRLESYMFTEESFRAVRDRLKPDGVLVIYNYFREPWLVDRLANTAAAAFGDEPRVHVHEARAFLGVLMAGPRLAQLTAAADRARSGHRVRAVARAEPGAPAPARSVDRAGDRRLAVPLHDAIATCRGTTRSTSRSCSSCRRRGARDVVGARRAARRLAEMVLAVLPARRRLHAARDEIDHPVRAAVGIDVGRRVAGDRVGADDGARRQFRRRAPDDHAPVARRRGARRAAGAELRRADRPCRLREPRGRVDVLRRPRVQPDPVRRAALRIRHQAIDLGGAGLRHQPARRDGRRRRRVPVARHRLSHAAARHRASATSAPSPRGRRNRRQETEKEQESGDRRRRQETEQIVSAS